MKGLTHSQQRNPRYLACVPVYCNKNGKAQAYKWFIEDFNRANLCWKKEVSLKLKSEKREFQPDLDVKFLYVNGNNLSLYSPI